MSLILTHFSSWISIVSVRGQQKLPPILVVLMITPANDVYILEILETNFDIAQSHIFQHIGSVMGFYLKSSGHCRLTT